MISDEIKFDAKYLNAQMNLKLLLCIAKNLNQIL